MTKSKFFKILKIGDYVNGYEVCNIDEDSELIFCSNYDIVFTLQQVREVILKSKIKGMNIKFVNFKEEQ